MKKGIISVLCLLLITCSVLAACGKKEPQDLTNSKYLGTWKAVSITFRDATDPFEDECTLTLNPDCTAIFYAKDSESETETHCNWEETDSGIKLLGDTKMNFSEDGDALVYKLAGSGTRFERQ